MQHIHTEVTPVPHKIFILFITSMTFGQFRCVGWHVAEIFLVLMWGPHFCGAPVRPNMLNMPKSATTTARHLRRSCRRASCLGKRAVVVFRCLPRGFYFRVCFSWIVGCSSIIDTSMQGSCQRQPCCHRSVMAVRERCCAFEL